MNDKDALYTLQLINNAMQYESSDPELFGRLVSAAMIEHGIPALSDAGMLPMSGR